jgi:hypothetical protein
LRPVGGLPLNKLPRTKLTLKKRAATLRTLLTKNASESKLLMAAGRVREARIQVLRAKIGEMPSVIYGRHSKASGVARLDEQIELLRAITPMAILNEFRLKRQKSSDDDRVL